MLNVENVKTCGYLMELKERKENNETDERKKKKIVVWETDSINSLNPNKGEAGPVFPSLPLPFIPPNHLPLLPSIIITLSYLSLFFAHLLRWSMPISSYPSLFSYSISFVIFSFSCIFLNLSFSISFMCLTFIPFTYRVLSPCPSSPSSWSISSFSSVPSSTQHFRRISAWFRDNINISK